MIHRRTLLAGIAGFLATAAGLFSGTASAQAAQPITIGVGAPFTGSSAHFGVQIRLGIEQALREINAAGGINGRPLRLQVEDDAGSQTEANKVALKLAGNPEVVAIVGHFNSSCSLAARGIYRDAGLLMFSPGSTNATVTLEHPNVFRNIFTDAFQGQSLAELVRERMNFERVAIIHENDDYGRGLSDFFVERAGQIGLNVVDRKSYDRDTTDFRPTLQAMVQRRPQAIVIGGLYHQAGLIARQAREQGINLPIIASDGVFSDRYIEIAGPAAEGTLISTAFLFDDEDERAMAFFNAVKEASGQEPDAWAALSYDAVMMVAEAIRQVGPDRRAIMAHMASITTEEAAFDGLTGRTFFDANGDSVKGVYIAEVRDGRFRKSRY